MLYMKSITRGLPGRRIHMTRRFGSAVLIGAVPLLALFSCGLFGRGGGGGSDTGIDAAYWGSWVRLDKEQYLYFGDEKVYARETLFDPWLELPLVSESESEIAVRDNGIVSGWSDFMVSIRPDAATPGWLKVTSFTDTAHYRKAGAKTASFKGSFKKDSALTSKASGGRALVSAGNISLVIQNVLNAQDRQTVTTDPSTGAFTATNVIAGDSFTVTPAAGAPVTVTPQQRGENIGVVNAPNKPYNFKAEYDFSPTPLDFGYFSAKFMVAGYVFTPIVEGGAGEPFDLYYDVTLRIRNTGSAAASNFSYELSPSAGLELRGDSDPVSGNVAGPIAAGTAHTISLHLRRPVAVDESKDVEVESIGLTVTDSEGYAWEDRVELYFWRKLIWLEVFRYHKEPLLGEIASPEGDASGAWLDPAGDAVEWYYLPYRREGYTVGVYPASEDQGQTKYTIGFEDSILGWTSVFETLTQDLNEPNDRPEAAKTLPFGHVVKGIIGPGDADFFKTGAQGAVVVDTEPPDPPAAFTATASDRSVTLTWTEPSASDYRYLKIEGGPPEEPDDLWRNPDKGRTSWTFTELTNGVPYSFTAWAVDWSGKESTPVYASATPNWDRAGARSYTAAGSFSSILSDPPDGRFSGPCDLAMHGSDYIVADTANNRVQRITSTGAWSYTWGRADGAAGGALGQFNAPSGVAVSGSTLYVADAGNHRIQAFDLAAPSQTPIDYWGGAGTGNGQFSAAAYQFGPNAISTDGNRLYVSDEGNNRVQVFDMSGDFQGQWTTAFLRPQGTSLHFGHLYIADYGHACIKKIPTDAAWGDASATATPVSMSPALVLPSDIAIDPSGGTMFVGERHWLRLAAYDSNGNIVWEKSGTAGSVGGPAGLAVDGSGNLVAADASRHLLALYATSDGAAGTTLGGPSFPGDGELDRPDDVALSPDGSMVYLSDSAYNRILVLSPDGSTLHARWGGVGGVYGTGAGQFREPRLLASDKNGRIYVADSLNHRVQIFESDGSFVHAIGDSAPGPSTATGSFDSPKDVALSPDAGRIFVSDYYNKRIQFFSASGYGYLGAFFCDPNESYRQNPLGIAVDALGGNIVAALESDHSVVRFDGLEGTPLWPQIVYRNQTSGVYDVETDEDGNIYVSLRSPATEGSINEIRKFSPAGSPIATIRPTPAFQNLAGIGLVPLSAPAGNHPGRIYAADGGLKKVFYFDPAE